MQRNAVTKAFENDQPERFAYRFDALFTVAQVCDAG